MEYQIIPNFTYLNRPVYTRNPAAAAAANAAPVNAVPYNNDDDSDEEDEPEDSWAGLHGIMGGKKRTRKYLSKNKRKSRKRRKSRRV